MVTKEAKKPAVAAPTPAAPAPNAVPAPAAAPAPVTATPAPTATDAPTPAPAPSSGSTANAPTTPPAATTTGTAASASPFVTAEGVQALVGMGFPESECRAALAAAMGNPDMAYEFLLTGIPDHLRNAAPGVSPPAAAPTSANTEPRSIESLRSHPQFNMLKQLVQSNPAALSQVLQLIGQQDPQLLAAIHANNDAFLAMMNEPITNDPPPAPAASAGGATAAAAPPGALPGLGGAGGNPLADPARFLQMMQALPPPQRAQLAQTMGMSPEQLEGFIQMMASMPPEQMQAMLGGAMGAGGMPGAPGGADPPGVIRLSPEEMEAVNRLVALGFTQQQAAQAYLACDKNESLAANLLFDGGWGDDEGMGGFGGGGGDEGDNGGDDMYS